MPSGNIAILTLTVAAGGELKADRLITQAGVYPAAGAAAFGVTRAAAAASAELVAVDIMGTTVVEVGSGGITKGGALMSDATGCVVALAGLSKSPVGIALETAVSGAFAEVLLVPAAGLLTPAS